MLGEAVGGSYGWRDDRGQDKKRDDTREGLVNFFSVWPQKRLRATKSRGCSLSVQRNEPFLLQHTTGNVSPLPAGERARERGRLSPWPGLCMADEVEAGALLQSFRAQAVAEGVGGALRCGAVERRFPPHPNPLPQGERGLCLVRRLVEATDGETIVARIRNAMTQEKVW